MTTAQFKEKYEALQKEAESLAAELKPLAKRYREFCRKACALGHKAGDEERLYRENEEFGIRETDGWSMHVLFRLTDFEDDNGFLLRDAYVLLLNLADQPFYRKLMK